MKKTKFLSLIGVLAFIVGGCSCSRINEETYEKAVSIYKSSDALSFSRLEIISKKGETTYSRKKTDAKFIFDSKRNVTLIVWGVLYPVLNTSVGYCLFGHRYSRTSTQIN